MFAIAALGCGEKRSETVIAEADAGLEDAGDAACRCAVIGQRFDLARACTSTTKEVLSCRSLPADGACILEELFDCWVRNDDAGGEVFFTPYTWYSTDLPGYVHCDEDLTRRVTAARECD